MAKNLPQQGKKSNQKKDAKGRRDAFYNAAKDSGWRARSVYKIIDMNKVHQFFKDAKSCIDLCSAPGSWCQVAMSEMKKGSTIIGVDLVKIHPIPGCAFIQGDITTAECRKALVKGVHLTGKDGKVKHHQVDLGTCDVVLHDGAPDMGANWDKDATVQNQLVLKSLELACEFLRPGGTFVTKVFQSKDSASLLYVMKALFEKVAVTKPKASRAASAETFFVCKGFKFSDFKQIDQSFFDIEKVFQNHEDIKEFKLDFNVDTTGGYIETTSLKDLSTLVQERDNPKKRGGYDKGMFMDVKVADFFKVKNVAEVLTNAGALVWTKDVDRDGSFENRIFNDPKTQAVKDLFADLRMNGVQDLKRILKWRHNLLHTDEKEKKSMKSALTRSQAKEDIANLRDLVAFHDEEQELEKELEEDETMTEEMREILLRKAREEKKKEKKQREKDKKNFFRMKISQTNIDVDPGQGDIFTNDGMKAVKAFKYGDQIDTDWEAFMGMKPIGYVEEFTEEELINGRVDDIVRIEKDDVFKRLNDDVKSTIVVEKAIKSGQDAETEALRLRKERRRERVFMERMKDLDAFQQKQMEEAAQGVSDSDSEMMEQDEHQKAEKIDEEGGSASDGDEPMPLTPEAVPTEEEEQPMRMDSDEAMYSSSEESDTEDDSDEFAEADKKHVQMMPLNDKKRQRKERLKRLRQEARRKEREDQAEDKLLSGLGGAIDDKEENIGFRGITAPKIEVVPTDPDDIAYIQAVGRKMVETKGRVEVMDGAYNRWVQGDSQNLPGWFNEEEDVHAKPILPVTKQQMDEMRAKLKEINERPIRKVVEASQRKKIKMAQKLEKVKKKAHQIAAQNDMGEGAKTKAIAKLTNRAKTGSGQREKRYVTSSANGSKKAGKLKSKSSSVVFVDRRMKSEKRAMRAIKRREK